VGSDPYLAPEVYTEGKYAPPPVDIWSLAIVFVTMSIRRFPWKVPRLTDNSFKLFAAPPSSNTPKSLLPRPKSTTHLVNPPEFTKDQDSFGNAPPQGIREDGKDGGPERHHHGHRHGNTEAGSKSEPVSHATDDEHDDALPEQPAKDVTDHKHQQSTSSDNPDAQSSSGPAPPQVDEHDRHSSQSSQSTPSQPIRGPWRLLRLLPRESRYVMSRMLQIDPTQRAGIQEIWEDSWIKSISFCWQEGSGTVHRAEGHDHHLVAAGEP
jgi:serine/threonine protein kinase